MQILFVHGMGRTRLSGLPMLMNLKKHGFDTSAFGYATTVHSFTVISQRLKVRIQTLAEQGEYVLVGHSLGGVLIRQALALLPAETPSPTHVFLVGSPIKPALLARQLASSPVFRALTRDCGALLGDPSRMASIPPLAVPTTSIVGTKGPTGKLSPFGDEINDSVVALSETQADWLEEEIQLPVVHTLLPASRRVAEVIRNTLAEHPNQ